MATSPTPTPTPIPAVKAAITPPETPKASAKPSAPPQTTRLSSDQKYRALKIEAKLVIDTLADNAAYSARLGEVKNATEAFDLKVRAMLRKAERVLAVMAEAEARAKSKGWKLEAFTARFVTPKEGHTGNGWLAHVRGQLTQVLEGPKGAGFDWTKFPPTDEQKLIYIYPTQVESIERSIENGVRLVNVLENPRQDEQLINRRAPSWGTPRVTGKTDKNRREGTLNRAAVNRSSRAAGQPKGGPKNKKK